MAKVALITGVTGQNGSYLAEFLLEKGYGIYNGGMGSDVTIRELAETIIDVVGFKGDLMFDTSKPDRPPRKLLHVGALSGLGWGYQIHLREGIPGTYRDYLASETA